MKESIIIFIHIKDIISIIWIKEKTGGFSLS